MGMYTGLRGKITLKDNGLSKVIIEKDFDWGTIRNSYFNETVSTWANVGRCNFIPFGAVCYMPDSWGDWFQTVDGLTLTFCCSLKNYECEIQTFIDKVLPEIAEDWSLESLYEESAYSTLYKKGQEPNEEFNTYKDYDGYDQYERAIEQKSFIDVFKLS